MIVTKHGKNLESIPIQSKKNAEKCFICNSPIINGGTWAGNHDVYLLSICNSQQCIENHIKWLIDAFISDEERDIRHFSTKDDFLALVEEIYVDKVNKNQKYKK